MTSPSLAELTVRDLTERLASRAPVPGGGSASALAGALGAALVEMVCELTVGRPQYQDVDPVARQVGAAAGELRATLLQAAEDDAAAYQAVADARRLPRETDDERAARKSAVSEATILATEVPLRIARLASEVCDLAATMAPIGNRNAVSDAGVAALLAAAAARAAALNVRINLPYLPGDHPLRDDAATQLASLDARVTTREAAALAAVDQRMGA
jgi:formiminotetrahydrofolate cyclodeaminase